MTPEDYERARRKTTRYGHRFDMSVNSKLPHDVVRTKAGKIAKRQPKYEDRPKAYYQAQCSFRGLKTTGSKEEMQISLKARDLAKDISVKAELDQLEVQMAQFSEQQEHARYKEWWRAAATSFEERLQDDPRRALEEELGKPDSILKRSCWKSDGDCYGLSRAAAGLGITYQLAEGPFELPPGAMPRVCHVVGDSDAVRKEAEAYIANAKTLAAEQWKTWKARQSAKKAADLARHQALYSEAKSAADWDLTGQWVIRCNELATYASERPEKLTMEILRDNFRLDAVSEGDPESEDEGAYYEDDDSEEDHEEDHKASTTESATDSSLPRFCARFQFGMVEGVMRIFPTAVTRARTSSSTACNIKNNPAFEYRWRGRETGEGEIQLEADNYSPTRMKFSDHGMKMEGEFDCPFIAGPLAFTGTKVTHGRGQQGSSAQQWGGLSERAWEYGRVARWH